MRVTLNLTEQPLVVRLLIAATMFGIQPSPVRSQQNALDEGGNLQTIEPQVDGNNDARKANDQAPRDEAKPAPAVALEPGRNLLGQRVANAPAEADTSGPSGLVKRVLGIIDESIRMAEEQMTVHDRGLDSMKKLQEMQIEYNQLGEKQAVVTGELAEIIDKRNRLSKALNFGPRNEQYQEFFRLKPVEAGKRNEIILLEKKKTTLPIQIRNLSIEVKRLDQEYKGINRKLDDLTEAWSRILSVLNLIPPQDATQIIQSCQETLTKYPRITPIRVMQGLCHIHQKQPKAAIEEFNKALELLGRVPSKITVCCLIGTAWALLDEGDVMQAASNIAAAKDMTKRNFELTICEARLAELRDRPNDAYRAYLRAKSIRKSDPASYRMVAMLIAKTNVRPVAQAVSAAKRACELDQFDDFRNSINLAYAHHVTEDTNGRDEAIQEAYRQAGDVGQPNVQEMTKALMNIE